MGKRIFVTLFLIIIINDIQSITIDKSIERLMINDSTFISLDLSERYLDSSAIRMLSKALEKNSYLRTLNLSRTNIDNEDTIILADALKINRTLKNLDLSRNRINNKGVIAIAKTLQVNRTLKTINLSYNMIGDEGAGALADALTVNNYLITIHLSWNNINNKGARKLAKALLVNRKLRNLDLNRNNINDDGIKSLEIALKENIYLTNLYLGFFNIEIKDYMKLENIDFYLSRNKSLTSLKLDFLRAFEKEINWTIRFKGIKFNEEFVKIRLGLKDIEKLNDLSSSELLSLLKWTYSEIYWEKGDIDIIANIIYNLQLKPISLKFLYKIDYIKNTELVLNKTFFKKVYGFVLSVRSKLIRKMLKYTLKDNKIYLYEIEPSFFEDRSNIEAYSIFIYFLYTNKLVLTGVNVTKSLFYNILELAEFYQINKRSFKSLRNQIVYQISFL